MSANGKSGEGGGDEDADDEDVTLQQKKEVIAGAKTTGPLLSVGSGKRKKVTFIVGVHHPSAGASGSRRDGIGHWLSGMEPWQLLEAREVPHEM